MFSYPRQGEELIMSHASNEITGCMVPWGRHWYTLIILHFTPMYMYLTMHSVFDLLRTVTSTGYWLMLLKGRVAVCLLFDIIGYYFLNNAVWHVSGVAWDTIIHLSKLMFPWQPASNSICWQWLYWYLHLQYRFLLPTSYSIYCTRILQLAVQNLCFHDNMLQTRTVDDVFMDFSVFSVQLVSNFMYSTCSVLFMFSCISDLYTVYTCTCTCMFFLCFLVYSIWGNSINVFSSEVLFYPSKDTLSTRKL